MPTTKKPATKRKPTSISEARNRRTPPTPFDDPEPPANLQDGQTMPGFDDEHPGVSSDTGAEQDTYLPPLVPPGYVTPPIAAQFANATWLRAGPEVVALVNEVLSFDEFAEIREFDLEICWRRATAPMRNGEPIFASAEIVPPRIIWESYQMGEERFPRFFVDLHWQHFDDLRRGREPGAPRTQASEETPPEGRSASYVHGGILQQHIHHALSYLEVENDILRKRQPDFIGFATTIKRFGQWSSGAAKIASQLALWPRRDE